MDGVVNDRAVNDSTDQQAGAFYQYLIALKDCFSLKESDILQIEVNGDVSVLSLNGGVFQKEVKHHFNKKRLSDRDIDFWKTLANWYTDYARVKDFSAYILFTTSDITSKSAFAKWNTLNKDEKLSTLKKIGSVQKSKETKFREQYNRIFNLSYDEKKLLNILEKFKIIAGQNSLPGISKDFAPYVGHIPKENRDKYIGALLGEILIQVKDPPHKWEIKRADFDAILERQSAVYGQKDRYSLPADYAEIDPSESEIVQYKEKRFVKEIQRIPYPEKITSAILDYWKADMTIAKYFRKNLTYLTSLNLYTDNLRGRMTYAKERKDLVACGKKDNEQVSLSKDLYLQVLGWEANDFGSITCNRDYFQRGVIHDIVDTSEFKWRVGEDADEHSEH